MTPPLLVYRAERDPTHERAAFDVLAGTRRRVRVAVVTPTHRRIDLLDRAMSSVQGQIGPTVQHIIVGDDCPELGAPGVTRSLLRRHDGPLLLMRRLSPGRDMGYPPARTAMARNIGILTARADFIADLGDHNELEPEYIPRLVKLLERDPGAHIAYSWRTLFAPDGRPFRPVTLNPWLADPPRSRKFFRDQVRFGILKEGEAEMRDPPVGPDGNGLHQIDLSELLVRSSTHSRLRFRTTFTPEELASRLCEDRAFCIDARRLGLRFVGSRRATIRYHLGGCSNERSAPTDAVVP